jgi:hypothetical protein
LSTVLQKISLLQRGAMYGRRGSGSTGTGTGSASTAASSNKEYKALLNYYLREKLWHHAQEEAAAQIKKRGSDASLSFWWGACNCCFKGWN